MSISSHSKWKNPKYSRSARRKRRRENCSVDNVFPSVSQTLVTDYFSYVDEFERVINENNDLRQALSSVQESYITKNDQDPNFPPNSLSHFLKELNLAAQNNMGKKKNNKFDNNLLQFCTYIYLTGGKMTYEILYSNLKSSIPSPSTVLKNIHGSERINESVIRFSELSEFLEARNLPKIIWISEDATGITGRIHYSSSTDTISGFVSPFDPTTGYPAQNCFPATSAAQIQTYFMENNRANYAYATLAQCPVDNAPFFCLNVFGTNNKFTYEDTLRRWNYLEAEATKFGIQILGFSSDGDTRLLKSMRIKSEFQNSKDSSSSCSWKWFHTNLSNSLSYVQDSVHIITKLRTRLLNSKISLQMGEFEATKKHLDILISTYSKDKHLLVESDLKAEDKMNFKSAEKIASEMVMNLLEGNHPESLGTVQFLKIMHYILLAFVRKNTTVRDRIYCMWFCIFFLRIWRYWIFKHNTLKLSNNFISLNAYLCIELNGHAIIQLNRYFRDNPEIPNNMFCPWLFSSQPCEQLF